MFPTTTSHLREFTSNGRVKPQIIVGNEQKGMLRPYQPDSKVSIRITSQ